MKDFNMNENEMNENENKNVNENEIENENENENEPIRRNDAEKSFADTGRENPNTEVRTSAEAKPAEGTYSFTRENIPNATYRAGGYGAYQPQPQPQHPQQPYGSYGSANPNTNPYGGSQYSNSYAPQNPYYKENTPDGDRISYQPDKKKKEHKSVSRGVVALVCCLTVVLSGCFGFAGAYLAASMNSAATVDDNGNVVSNSGKTAVVYRTVDDIVTSTGAAKGEPLTYSEVASLVKDSVVEINTEYTVQNMWYQYVTGGAGSGVIISDNGYIITNNHVICDDSGTEVADNITVRLTNGEEYAASVIGHDSDSDIAVLKIEAQNLTFAVAGNSDTLAVGEEVVIVGNPLGELGGTVTNGIVSATEREILVGGVTMTLIQTNAAVNPGNSGGGMFNMKGELVGIVNAKSSGTGIEGLGFAIPINDALNVNEQLLEYGYVRGKTMIGVTFQTVTNSSSFMYYYNLKPGVYVGALTPGYNDDVLEEGDRV
ncbi:MAG: S1C family serine protease, partial [Eubacteriales bacterium]